MTNGTVIDTSIWIDYFKSLQNENAQIINHLIDVNEVIILPVILQETLQGIKEDKIFEFTREWMLAFKYITIDYVNVSLKSAELYRFLRKKRITIRKPNDCLIAAICIENNISLFHNDKDFDNIAKYTSLIIYKPET
ncbi:MAG: PIN domain-containing protein [Bacteroidota bacterium]|nr:PIN domain-containing protein [Bacteroidota bacterium]